MEEPRKIRKYPEELKRNAVQRVLNGERSAVVAKEIGIRYTLLDRWRRQFIKKQNEQKKAKEESDEIERLRQMEKYYQEFAADLESLKAERDIAIQGILFLLNHITSSTHTTGASE